MTRPFLSVVTRCYKRPKSLRVNQASLLAQSDQDFEQIFILDKIGKGLHAANKSFFLNRKRVNGEYVLILDDDDLLVYEHYIRDLKQIVKKYNPDVVISKMSWMKGKILPEPAVWDKRPREGHIGSPNFVVRHEVWIKHIESFGTRSRGDFHFINAVWAAGYLFYWWDKVTSKIQRKGRGRPGP